MNESIYYRLELSLVRLDRKVQPCRGRMQLAGGATSKTIVVLIATIVVTVIEVFLPKTPAPLSRI